MNLVNVDNQNHLAVPLFCGGSPKLLKKRVMDWEPQDSVGVSRRWTYGLSPTDSEREKLNRFLNLVC